LFLAVMDCLLATLRLEEPLYTMDRAGGFRMDDNGPAKADGREFIVERLRHGGEMLGAIWVTAWRGAPPDPYLQAQLIKRQDAAAKAKP
jgi:hypothetical protein